MIALATLALSLAASAGPLCSPATPSGAVCTPAPDPALKGRIDALLGSIDRPVKPEDWRRLPAEARPVLEALAADPGEFPSRRAHALDGLAALGGDAALHQRLAQDPKAPVLVRNSALEGLGRLLPPDQAGAALLPIVTGDADGRVRAAAARVLAAAAPGAGCSTIRAQVAREDARTRAAFSHAVRSCGDR